MTDVEFEVAKLKLEAGDVIVLRSRRRFNQRMAIDLRDLIKEKFPSNEVVVMDSMLDLATVSSEEVQRGVEVVKARLGDLMTRAFAAGVRAYDGVRDEKTDEKALTAFEDAVRGELS